MTKAPRPHDTVLSQVVSTSDLAALLALSERRIEQLVQEGVIPKAGPGRYRLGDVVPTLFRKAREDARTTTASNKQGRLAEAKAREVELRIAEKQRELVPIEEAVGAVDAVCGMIRTELSGLPARMSRDTNERAKLESELDGILSRVAVLLDREGANLRAGGGDAEAVTEDDAGSMGEDE